MGGSAKLIAIVLLPAILLGCSSSPGSFLSRQTAEGALLMDGPPARMTANALNAQQQNEIPLLYSFALEAKQINLIPAGGGPPAAPATSLVDQQIALQNVQDWSAVILVGEGYIDRQCQHFLAALDRLEKEKKTTLADLNLVQSATVGIMGLALAAQRAIGITGIAFGLAAGLFDTTTSTVLYQLPVASVSSIVEAQRQSLRADEAEILPTIKTPGLAAARLGTYIQYCVPLTIETNIAKVLSHSMAGPDQQIITSPTRAAVTSAIVITHDAAYKSLIPTKNLLISAIRGLSATQVLALSNSLGSMMHDSPAATQAELNAIDPTQLRFSDAAMARRVLLVWLETTNSLTSSDLEEWSRKVASLVAQ